MKNEIRCFCLNRVFNFLHDDMNETRIALEMLWNDSTKQPQWFLKTDLAALKEHTIDEHVPTEISPKNMKMVKINILLSKT